LPLVIAPSYRNNFIEADSKKYGGLSLMSDDWHVAHVWDDSDDIDGLKAAAYIVQAVNSYLADQELIGEMKEALQYAQATLEVDGCDCGDTSDPPCALCMVERILAKVGKGER